MSAPRTARDRVRAELSREILSVAKRHLAQDGPTDLSLRSIARELEMAPSALYRYFSSRDDLLTALVLDAYGSLADSADETASAPRWAAATDAHRWLEVARAIRRWAVANPHEWGLIFGSPVPGYQAPQETVVPYARLAGALVRPVSDAFRRGTLEVDAAPVVDPAALAATLAPVSAGLGPELPLTTISALVRAWSTLIGIISLEIFGHWHNTVLDPELLFEETIRRLARSVGLAEGADGEQLEG